MSVESCSNNKKITNPNDIIRKSIYNLIMDSLDNDINLSELLISLKKEEIYKNITSVLYCDVYTYLKKIKNELLVDYDHVYFYNIINQIKSLEEIDEFILEDMLKLELEYLSLNPLVRKLSFLELTEDDHHKLQSLNDKYILDIIEYSKNFELEDLLNIRNELYDHDMHDYDIVEMIFTYLMVLKKKHPNMYNYTTKQVLTYTYKWYKYLADKSFDYMDLNHENSFIDRMENNSLDQLASELDEDTLFEAINTTLFYLINKKDRYVNKNEEIVDITIEDVEKHYEKIK